MGIDRGREGILHAVARAWNPLDLPVGRAGRDRDVPRFGGGTPAGKMTRPPQTAPTVQP